MPKITNINANEILDSQGHPTLLTSITIEDCLTNYALVPSGTSVGIKEALELRDNNTRFNGKGVLKAQNNVNTLIKDLLLGQDSNNQRQIDDLMIKLDNTPNKEKLGANSILSVSLANARVTSNYYDLPLYKYLGGALANKIPVPMINILNGGRHANNSLDFQEYMIVPYNFPTLKKALEASSEIFYALKDILQNKNFPTTVGLEGGFAPSLSDNEEPLKLIMEAIKKAGYKPYEEILIALDVASSEFYNQEKSKYHLNKKDYTAEELISYYEYLINKYPIVSIEDGLDQNDDANWKIMTERLGHKILLIGDDLFVTNKKLLKKGIQNKIANGILIKPNQIGTLSETVDAINLAKENSYITIISHRSGDTEDTFISDLAVGLSCPFIKTGSLSRSERISKYNRLLMIEQELKEEAHYNNDFLKEFFINKKP